MCCVRANCGGTVMGMEQEHVRAARGRRTWRSEPCCIRRAYPDKARKDILIDGLLRLDFTDDGEVHEIKKSKGGEKATLYQLLYYLYYLKHVKGIETTGMIDYPLQKRREDVR